MHATRYPREKFEIWDTCILGYPGVDSGGEGKSKRAEKNMARRKVKNGEKSPWGRSGKTLSPGTLLFVSFFSARVDFPRPHYLPPGLPGWDMCLLDAIS